MSKQIIVIGAGAAGLMAAGRASELGAKVLLLEKMAQPGNKILISGKTRCNLTNTKELDDFIRMYGENGRFLYPAFRRFFREDLLELLKCYGVETTVERGGRVFPVSNNAEDVVAALLKYLKNHGGILCTGVPVTRIEAADGRVTGVKVGGTMYPTQAVVLAAGGSSYPATGSSGDGYRLAAGAGHTIVELRPALVPLVVREIDLAKSIQGVSLKNIRLTSFSLPAEKITPGMTPQREYGRGIDKKAPVPVIESRTGEMLFTHFGIGGPITLLMSLAVVDALNTGPVSVSIDLKPALSESTLRERLQREFDTAGKRSYKNILKTLLPEKMIDLYVRLTGIPPEKPGNQIVAAEKEKLLGLLKSLLFNIEGPLPLSSAIVTAGGVSLKEVDPRTMSSKLVKGLFFSGEVLDIDADTGGYNLQAAFSTGYLAGESAAKLVSG